MKSFFTSKAVAAPLAALMLSLAAAGTAVPSAQASANVVPDAALRSCINDTINNWAEKWKPEIGNRAPAAPVTAADITNYLYGGTFRCDGKGVTSLEGLQYATDPKKIWSISVKNNNITDFSPVSKLSNLTALYLDYNNIATMPSNLSGLSSVKNFYIEGNKLTSVGSVKGMANLELLNINYNSVESLDRKSVV